jgi:HTH-type transcriptional regulator, glycine betaine synthesis regulator
VEPHDVSRDIRSPRLVSAVWASMPQLTPLEIEVVDLFAAASRLVSLPRSVGEIYGLLFITAKPLTLDVLAERLQMSKGSASQGLRTLRQCGAAKLTRVPGDRRDHYLAETELKKLISSFIRRRLLPPLEAGAARLRRLRRLQEPLARMDGSARAVTRRDRISKLEQWYRRARDITPVLEKALR